MNTVLLTKAEKKLLISLLRRYASSLSILDDAELDECQFLLEKLS